MEEKYPALLKSFENKVFIITLQISCNNLKKGSRVYDAYEIGDKIESGANFDPEEQMPSDLPSASTVNVSYSLDSSLRLIISSQNLTIYSSSCS